MIPVKDISTVTDNINGAKTKMTVRSEDWAKISGLLINLYSDVQGAVLREYSTNAWDSHIESGNTDTPIEVILPNAFLSVLSIKDFGSGMTRQTLEEVYCMFGASTKDTSNDFNGSMGLGSKSALTYADAFTIITVKDGKSNTAIVSRDEEGNGVMELLDEQDTTEPNGTTIQVPVKEGDEGAFRQRAHQLYSYFPEGKVLVNGTPNVHVDLASNGYEEMLPGKWIKTERFSGNRLFIHQGNVVYKHDFEQPPELKVNLNLFAFVPNGSVMYAPSREALLMNKKTEKFVNALLQEMIGGYVQRINDEMHGAKTLKEAIDAFRKYSGIISDGVSEWKGIKLGISADYPGGRHYSVNNDETGKSTTISAVSGYSSDTVFLTNMGKGHLTRQQKDAITAYRNSLPTDKQFRIVYYKSEVPPLFSEARILDYEKHIKPLVKSAASAKAANPTYDLYHWVKDKQHTDGGYVSRDTIPLPKGKKKVYLYTSPKHIRGGWNNSFYSMKFIKYVPDVVVIVIGENRHDKFKMENPGSKELRDWTRDYIAKEVKKFTPDELEAAKNGDSRMLKFFDGKTDDKHIDKLCRSVVSYSEKVQRIMNVLSEIGDQYQLNMALHGTRYPSGMDYLASNYPLVSTYDTRKIEHSIKYINMIYNEDKDKV